MKRHFYVSDDLDDLDRIEEELEKAGVHRPQIHVFSKDESGIDTHDHLHGVESLFKKDIVHGTIIGTWIGIAAAAIVLIGVAYTDLPQDYSWMPFIFLAIVLLGFGAWSGGLYGIQEPHHDFKRFEPLLRAGKHVFIVDVDPEQEAALDRVVVAHPKLKLAGEGRAAPRWIIMSQHKIKKFTSETFP